MDLQKGTFRLRMGKSTLSEVILFLYLTMPILNVLFRIMLSLVGLGTSAVWLSCILVLTLYFLRCAMAKKLLVPEFWLFYFLIALFFLITYLYHPEYEYWYTRSDYGVINYVLRPNNGIFLYLFIRLVNDPKKIIKTIKTSAWPIYLWYGYQVMQAMARGYWVDTSNRGYEIHMSYNLSLGYNVLLFVLPFLYSALAEKKLTDWIGAFVGIAIILVAGSRGPFLDIGIFLAIYVLLKFSNSRKKIPLAFAIIAGSILLWISYPFLISQLAALLEKLNLSSRMISKLVSGEALDDSNRLTIWNAAIEMIKENPFGYGAMGSRHVISRYIYVAHPHQFFLEVLVDFGVIFGSAIILWLVWKTVKLFTMKGQDEWKAVFLVFFARACQLLVSLTFWHSIGLWGALAVGVCMSKAKRKELKYGRQQDQ